MKTLIKNLKRICLLIGIFVLANLQAYTQSSGVYVGDSSSVYIPSGASAGVWGDTMQLKGHIGMADSTSSVFFQGNVWRNDTTASVSSGRVIMNDTLMQTIIGRGSYSSIGSSFSRLELNNPAGVNLLNSNLRVDSQFVLSKGILFTNHNDILFGPLATVKQTDSTSFVTAEGGGGVSKFYNSNSPFVFPVGCYDASPLYNPLQLNVSAAAYNPLSYARVTMTDSVHAKKTPRHDIYGEKSWSVRFNNLSIDSAKYMASYNSADQFHGDTSKIGGSSWANGEWSYSGKKIGGKGITVTGTLKSNADIFGQNRSLTVNAKTIIEGPWNGTTMTTTLRNLNLIPLGQPYGAAPFNITGFNYTGLENRSSLPANTVDWLLLELRSTPTGATIDRSVGLLLSNGTIVDGYTDGPLEFPNAPDGNYFLVVKHRNHLAIMSATPITLPNTSPYDFTSAMSKAYGVITPMADLGGGKFGLWGGNVIPDIRLRASGPGTVNDVNKIEVILGSPNNIMNNVYNLADVNFDGKVRATGPGTVNDYNKLITFLGALNLIVTQPF